MVDIHFMKEMKVRIKQIPRKVFIIVFFCAALFIFKLAFKYLPGFLAWSSPADANILVIEGWLPFNILEKAYLEYQFNSYDYVVTTGLPHNNEYFVLPRNGFLIFNSTDIPAEYKVNTDLHVFEIDAFSELGNEHAAHFNFYVNDILVTDFLADKYAKKYRSLWQGELAEVDSFMVQYDNDANGFWGDRSLYVKEIIIDHGFTISYSDNSVYEISEISGNRILNNTTNYAELARNWLFAMGLDSTIIIPVPCKKVLLNRTLHSAQAIREWLSKSEVILLGLNIVSVGIHSRRRWMTHN